MNQTEHVQPNEVVTDNKDPDKLNHSTQTEENQPGLAGEAKGMLDLGGALVKKSLEDSLDQAATGTAIGYGGKLGMVDTNSVEQPAAGAAIGYGGKLGIADTNTADQSAISTALGYGGKLGIVPEE
jgi:hypothetical protein